MSRDETGADQHAAISQRCIALMRALEGRALDREHGLTSLFELRFERCKLAALGCGELGGLPSPSLRGPLTCGRERSD